MVGGPHRRTGGLALTEVGLEAGGAAPRSHRARRDFSMGDGPVPIVHLALAEAGGGTAGGRRSTTAAIQRHRGRGSSTHESGNEARMIFDA
jgi:hypothetical protein